MKMLGRAGAFFSNLIELKMSFSREMVDDYFFFFFESNLDEIQLSLFNRLNKKNNNRKENRQVRFEKINFKIN